jgi:hypothetical protein
VNEVRRIGQRQHSRREVVSDRPLAHGQWPLVVTFWVFSLLFGLGAALGAGWGFPLLLAYVLLASATAMVPRALAW